MCKDISYYAVIFVSALSNNDHGYLEMARKWKTSSQNNLDF
ncbi:hypothetical protein [Ulvibacterium sp.]|nr:hypothetical protein [Ulvibacterium sp.]